MVKQLSRVTLLTLIAVLAVCSMVLAYNEAPMLAEKGKGWFASTR